MNQRKDRREFAKSRPLPPFGVILKWLVDALQLRDLATYELDTDGLDSRRGLKEGLNVFGGRTSDDVFAGLIVKEDTKQRTCAAFAACLRELPGMPFGSVPLERLTAAVRDL